MNQLIKKYRMVLSAIYCLILPYSFVSYGAEAESVIRVGFPVQSGLTMKDENGKAYAYRDSEGNYYELDFGLTLE